MLPSPDEPLDPLDPLDPDDPLDPLDPDEPLEVPALLVESFDDDSELLLADDELSDEVELVDVLFERLSVL